MPCFLFTSFFFYCIEVYPKHADSLQGSVPDIKNLSIVNCVQCLSDAARSRCCEYCIYCNSVLPGLPKCSLRPHSCALAVFSVTCLACWVITKKVQPLTAAAPRSFPCCCARLGSVSLPCTTALFAHWRAMWPNSKQTKQRGPFGTSRRPPLNERCTAYRPKLGRFFGTQTLPRLQRRRLPALLALPKCAGAVTRVPVGRGARQCQQHRR